MPSPAIRLRRTSPLRPRQARLRHADTPVAAPATADTLVVCDACELPDGVSAVAPVREQGRIRFDVDTARVRDGGAAPGSQLLRLTRHVL